jgi:tetratricopeptide (TPR) repeat protein
MAVLACLWMSVAAAAYQPDTAVLRRLFEENLARREREFGVSDARTAQAARDLGLFLQRAGDAAGAHRALAEAVRVDEKALGPAAPQTLEDVSSLAEVSVRGEAEGLLRRAAESPDAAVAGQALSTLGAYRRAAGDRVGAAAYLRRAVEKAEQAMGKDDPIVALVLVALSQVVDAKEAAAVLQRAVAIDEKALGARDPQTVQAARALAAVRKSLGQ